MKWASTAWPTVQTQEHILQGFLARFCKRKALFCLPPNARNTLTFFPLLSGTGRKGESKATMSADEVRSDVPHAAASRFAFPL